MVYRTEAKENKRVKLTSGVYVSISHILPAIEILRSHAGMGLDDALLTIGCSRGESELIRSYFNKQK